MVVHLLGVEGAAVRFPPTLTNMRKVKVKCSFCEKKFSRETGRFNEAKKFGWNQYCSKECQRQAKIRGVEKICANCKKRVFREPNELKKSKSGRVFCSPSCAAIFNNSFRRVIRTCPICGKQFSGQKKYCSQKCSAISQEKPKFQREREILNEIKTFYKAHKRIPVKRERPGLALRAHFVFGGWNKAIETAGFKPNPVIFSKKFIAKDGHKCDSFAEKIIDDWLYSNNVEHQRNIPYPNSPYTADFLIKGKLVEFFGLNGELKEYDKNTKLKEKLAEKHRLKLIKIFPKDLFPINHLSEIIRIKNK